MNRMKAVVFSGIGKYDIIDKQVPRISSSDQVLVKIEASSICGSDIHVLSEPPGQPATIGVVLGHEFVGRIVETGDNVKNLKVGDRIVCDPNIYCGYCRMCQLGYYNLCKNMVTIGINIDGGFTEYVLVPEKVAIKITDSLPTDIAIFTEPINCVMGGINKIRLLPGETVLVLGAGPIGLYFTSLLKANGAGKIIVSEISDFRKNFASEMGADLVINPLREDLLRYVMDATDGYGVDIVIDAVGSLIEDSIKCVRPGGKILLFGINAAEKQTICQTDIVWKGITIVGNFIGRFTLEPTVRLLERKLVDFTRLITHRIKLVEFGKGLEAMKDGTAIKVVIYPGGEKVV